MRITDSERKQLDDVLPSGVVENVELAVEVIVSDRLGPIFRVLERWEAVEPSSSRLPDRYLLELRQALEAVDE